MNGLLVRVGTDSTDGCWNAPMRLASGEFAYVTDRAYRVRNDLLDAWGGRDIKDGYIHRSVRLPAFHITAKFHRWFVAQKPELVAEYNQPT